MQTDVGSSLPWVGWVLGCLPMWRVGVFVHAVLGCLPIQGVGVFIHAVLGCFPMHDAGVFAHTVSPLIAVQAVPSMVQCCFTATETVGLLEMGAQDGHLDFHTAPEL